MTVTTLTRPLRRGRHRRSALGQLGADFRDLFGVLSVEASVFVGAVVACVGAALGASL